MNNKKIIRGVITDNNDYYMKSNIQSGTYVYLYIALFILTLGFFGGVILGNEFSIESGYINTLLMIEVWVGTALFSIIPFGIFSICRRQDLLISKK